MSGDAAFLRRWQRRRDADAFAEVVHRHSGLVIGVCARILRDHAQAEEVAQECFLRFSQQDTAVEWPAAWLCRTAARASLNRRRDEQRRKEREVAFARENEDVENHDADLQEALA